jgi:hypothetical protein
MEKNKNATDCYGFHRYIKISKSVESVESVAFLL